jgi:hypothetical protein
MMYPIAKEKRTLAYKYSWSSRSIMINSFWGLDKAEALPPNYVQTGPLTKSSDSLIENFKEKDMDLYLWMNKAYEDN